MDSSKKTMAMRDDEQAAGGAEPAPGLRSRKKARRHEEILDQARALFSEKGVDAVTMAEIAEAAGVSTPTVFNYFGNKDGILIAMITEGAQHARDNSKVMEPRTDVDFLSTLMTVFMDISVETMEIASKRIWRYANAAAIRHSESEFARSFQDVDAALIGVIEAILGRYSLTLHDGSAGDARHIAQLFFDVWLNTFQVFIGVQDMTIEAHEEKLRARFAPLCKMIFAPEFLARPTLADVAPH
ncbi:TetR/AcrR family transcriptional regulator [Sagittula sp.]|uniref:TetR/AcrR family transcriptional regulator n=1 Tax=Sagittula sp. TaxID=2038081 RepID=UPI00351902C0